jgi:hypothetical protein
MLPAVLLSLLLVHVRSDVVLFSSLSYSIHIQVLFEVVRVC